VKTDCFKRLYLHTKLRGDTG